MPIINLDYKLEPYMKRDAEIFIQSIPPHFWKAKYDAYENRNGYRYRPGSLEEKFRMGLLAEHVAALYLSEHHGYPMVLPETDARLMSSWSPDLVYPNGVSVSVKSAQPFNGEFAWLIAQNDLKASQYGYYLLTKYFPHKVTVSILGKKEALNPLLRDSEKQDAKALYYYDLLDYYKSEAASKKSSE